MAPDDDKTQAVTVLTKGTVIGHYRIVEKIGAGGMGEVYLAEDTKLNRQVALKFLSPHLCQDEACRQRFEREAQAAAKLDHPNIVTVYEVGDFQGRPFFAMQHIEGRSLREYARDQELTIPQVVEIGIHIAEGLQAAHEKGVTHRDIKPANVLIDSHGRARILDFGLASVAGVDHLTKTGSTLGTIGYMSPEQVRGEQVDQRTDIFSLGVVLYELITGRQPFKGDNDTATSRNILDTEPEPLARYKSGVNPELQRVISKALAKDKSIRYQHADELAADLRGASAMHSTTFAAGASGRPQRRSRIAVLAALLVIVIATFLILKPWKFILEPTEQAIGTENKLAIMYFDNLADPTDSLRLAEIATNLLITGFESQYLRVVSSQRLYDILKLLGKEGVKRVDRSTATQVANKANAKQMLLGSVLQVSPEIVLTSQVIDVASGNVIASQRVTGAVGETVFPIIDRLSVELKKDLSLPQAALNEPALPTADLTTRSPEAYRYYVEGVNNVNKYYWPAAENSFKRALEFDSTFAMAYQWLALINAGTKLGQVYIARAVKYSDKVSHKEKLYIKMQEANIAGNRSQAISELQQIVASYPEEKDAFGWLGATYSELGQFEESIRYFNRALAIDPLYKNVYNQLAYVYDKVGDFEKSLWALNKYIELAPDEANPYDTRGDLYAKNGKLVQAIESYQIASAKKPNFSVQKLGIMYLLKREYARADSCFRAMCSSTGRNERAWGRSFLAFVPTYQGKFREALRLLDDGIGADRIEQEGFQEAYKYYLKARIFEEMNQMASALHAIKLSMEIARAASPKIVLYWQDHYAPMLAKNGDMERADAILVQLKKDIATSGSSDLGEYWSAAGRIALLKGNVGVAVRYCERAAKLMPVFSHQFELANAYLAAGKLDKAVTEFEIALSNYDVYRVRDAISAVKAHYLLGVVYEKSGWTDRAIEKYEEFLDIWKDADPGVKEVDDAKVRLARLKTGT